jgi:hypothetical protein
MGNGGIAPRILKFGAGFHGQLHVSDALLSVKEMPVQVEYVWVGYRVALDVLGRRKITGLCR